MADKWDRDKYIVQENGGMKDDSGKLLYDLLPPGPIRQLVQILTFGARKYAPNNWQKVDQERYRNAMMRHYEAWREGEDLDQDSGMHHLAHAMCNIMFMLWQETCNSNQKQIDLSEEMEAIKAELDKVYKNEAKKHCDSLWSIPVTPAEKRSQMTKDANPIGGCE